jgi:hypothetical protein
MENTDRKKDTSITDIFKELRYEQLSSLYSCTVSHVLLHPSSLGVGPSFLKTLLFVKS